jgi:hypothetical protein
MSAPVTDQRLRLPLSWRGREAIWLADHSLLIDVH